MVLVRVLPRSHAPHHNLCLDAVPRMMVGDQHGPDYDGQRGSGLGRWTEKIHPALPFPFVLLLRKMEKTSLFCPRGSVCLVSPRGVVCLFPRIPEESSKSRGLVKQTYET